MSLRIFNVLVLCLGLSLCDFNVLMHYTSLPISSLEFNIKNVIEKLREKLSLNTMIDAYNIILAKCITLMMNHKMNLFTLRTNIQLSKQFRTGTFLKTPGRSCPSLFCVLQDGGAAGDGIRGDFITVLTPITSSHIIK